MVVDPRDRACEAHGRAVRGGRGRVPAVVARGQLEVEDPLLRDPDDGRRGRHAGHRPLHDGAALVEHEPGPDAALGEAGDGRTGAVARGLLVVPERQVHVARRGPARSHERLDGLEGDDERSLVVERAPPPHGAVPDDARERRVAPAGRVGLDVVDRDRQPGDGDDVVVGHEDERVPFALLAAGPAPPEQDAPAVRDVRCARDELALEDAVHVRVQRLEERDELVEPCPVDLLRHARGDRRDADERGQADGDVVGGGQDGGGHGAAPAGSGSVSENARRGTKASSTAETRAVRPQISHTA